MVIFGARFVFKLAAVLTTGFAGLMILFGPNPHAPLNNNIRKALSARIAGKLSTVTPNNFDKIWVIQLPEINTVSFIVTKRPVVVDQNNARKLCVQYRSMYFIHHYDKAQQMDKIRSFESGNSFCRPFMPNDEAPPSSDEILTPARELNLPNATLG